jgi:hypothetical protein
MENSRGGKWWQVQVDKAGTDPQTGQTNTRMIRTRRAAQRKVGTGFPTQIMRKQ